MNNTAATKEFRIQDTGDMLTAIEINASSPEIVDIPCVTKDGAKVILPLDGTSLAAISSANAYLRRVYAATQTKTVGSKSAVLTIPADFFGKHEVAIYQNGGLVSRKTFKTESGALKFANCHLGVK